MSVQSEINRLKQAVTDAFTAIGNKGGTVPSSKVINNLEAAINSIPAGAQIEIGTYTVASKVSGSTTMNLQHNLGFIPRVFILYRDDGIRPSTDYALTFFGKYVTDPTNGRGAGGAVNGRSSTSKNASGHAKINLSGTDTVFQDTENYSVIWGAYNSASSLYMAAGDTYTYVAVKDWEGNF